MSLFDHVTGIARSGAVGAAVLLALGLSTAPSLAKDYKVEGAFAWVAKGEMLQTGKDRLFWVGSYNGVNIMADPESPLQNVALVCPGALDVGVESHGYCQDIVDKDNILYVQWNTDGKFPAGNGKFTYIGGTGKFADAKGGGEFTYTFASSPNPDGTQSGTTVYHNAVLTLAD